VEAVEEEELVSPVRLDSSPQPPQTTWPASGAWRPGRSRGSTAGTRRPSCVWPSTTACWAEEEEEEEEENVWLEENGGETR